jgi:hypothetical protein
VWEDGRSYPASVVAFEEGDTITVRWKDSGLDSTIASELVTPPKEVSGTNRSLDVASRGDIRSHGSFAGAVDTAAKPPPPQGSETVAGAVLRELTRSGKLVSSRVALWWNGDQKWYSGTVTASPAVDKFLVLYDDKELIIESVDSTVALYSADCISQVKAGSVKAVCSAARPHGTKPCKRPASKSLVSEERFWNVADLSLASSFFTGEKEEVHMRKKTRQIRDTECKEISGWSAEMIPIVVKNAGEKGLGGFAKKRIRQGEFIGEFAGEVVRTVCCSI